MAAEGDNEPLQEFWPRAKLSLMPSIVNGDIVNPGDTISPLNCLAWQQSINLMRKIFSFLTNLVEEQEGD